MTKTGRSTARSTERRCGSTHRRRKRGPADRTNELAKIVAEELGRKYPATEPPDLASQLGIGHAECMYCSRPCKPSNIDELVPPTKGGTMRRCNLVSACGLCNSSKGALTGEDLELWLVRRGSHVSDSANYISAERALVVAEYIGRHEATLRWTGAALDEFNEELAYRKRMYAEVDRHMAERGGSWHGGPVEPIVPA
jgi:5-methylcytosine-specific restriction endonuclease McrA